MSERPLELASAEGARQSNLAFALGGLPRERRDDAMVFYDFCRAVDDIADSEDRPAAEKSALLERWKSALATRKDLPPRLEALIGKYRLDATLLIEIIRGVEMDIQPQAYETYEDLRAYCWRVACAVGLVSIEIFGCRDPLSKAYAENLGQALQLTNILRDVAEDAAMGRIYLPREDLRKFGVTEAQLLEGAPEAGFGELMQFEAERAETLFRKTVETWPRADAAALLPAEIMRVFYEKLLRRMRADGFRVFAKRYRLGKLEKLFTLLYARFSSLTANRRLGMT
jgi:phytoene synthase